MSIVKGKISDLIEKRFEYYEQENNRKRDQFEVIILRNFNSDKILSHQE